MRLKRKSRRYINIRRCLMSKCAKCGRELSGNERFCPDCGNSPRLAR
ncbi:MULTISPECIES: zinc-ribbon domain-containing protein [unclassified Butyrivibrio]